MHISPRRVRSDSNEARETGTPTDAVNKFILDLKGNTMENSASNDTLSRGKNDGYRREQEGSAEMGWAIPL